MINKFADKFNLQKQVVKDEAQMPEVVEWLKNYLI